MAEDSVTAVDYLESQLRLEREARELMPFEPDECTFEKGELRQPVFACLTCSKENNDTPIGVCYSCSIQCHSTHELVELFTKRNFTCDCGTTKMAKTSNGACQLRRKGNDVVGVSSFSTTTTTTMTTGSSSRRFSSTSASSVHLDLPAEDIPSLSNIYNQNYMGTFCSCKKPYNPLEETGNMIQCYFGFVCGEDWYHEECILGYDRGTFKTKKQMTGGNILHKLAEPGEEALVDQLFNTTANESVAEDDDEVKVPHFPDLEDFEVFICWKCVEQFKLVFELIEDDKEIVFSRLPHFNGILSESEWEQLYSEFISSKTEETTSKRIKLETKESGTTPYSLFLTPNFREKLILLTKILDKDSSLLKFLLNHEYLYLDDPVFEPPEEALSNDGASSATGSLLDLGSAALLSLPREKAIEGLQAYDKIRSKLREFFKPFAEKGEVVAEDKVREFFAALKDQK